MTFLENMEEEAACGITKNIVLYNMLRGAKTLFRTPRGICTIEFCRRKNKTFIFKQIFSSTSLFSINILPLV